MPQTIYTKKEYENIKKDTDNYSMLLDCIARSLSEACREEHIIGKEKLKVNNKLEINGNQCWQYIPTMPTSFYNILSKVKNYMKKEKIIGSGYCTPRFLEPGCGVGFNLMIANRLGFDSTGLEYSDKVIGIGKQIFSNSKIIKNDIMKYTDYDKFDVIFYYMPLVDTDHSYNYDGKKKPKINPLKTFDNLVMKNLKPNGIIISKEHKLFDSYNQKTGDHDKLTFEIDDKYVLKEIELGEFDVYIKVEKDRAKKVKQMRDTKKEDDEIFDEDDGM